MEAKFALYRVYGDKDGEMQLSIEESRVEFSTIEEVFDYLSTKEHNWQDAVLHSAPIQASVKHVQSPKNFDIIYESLDEAAGDEEAFKLAEGVKCYYLRQTKGENLTYEHFCQVRNERIRKGIQDPSTASPTLEFDLPLASKTKNKLNFLGFLYKLFHPGNSLFVAIILTAVGIGLISFGVVCPPALVFFALGAAAFSAALAIIYAIHYLKYDYTEYKAKIAEEQNERLNTLLTNKDNYVLGELSSFKEKSYFGYCKDKLFNWVDKHRIQTGLMIAGFVLFLAALIVVTGGLAGVPIFATAIGAGAFGGAIGLTSGFFATGIAAIPTLASIAPTLSLALGGIALILGPVTILDTIRRFVSGIYYYFNPGIDENPIAKEVNKSGVGDDSPTIIHSGDTTPSKGLQKHSELDSDALFAKLEKIKKEENVEKPLKDTPEKKTTYGYGRIDTDDK